MSLIYINTMLVFTISLVGMLMYWSHLVSSLLCLEGMMLLLFMMITITILSNHFTLGNMVSIILLALAACEAALRLSFLVLVSNTHGTNYVQNLNLLQC